MPKEIIVTVAKDGEIKIDAVGFIGRSCATAFTWLEKALGLAKSSQKKAEYFQKEPQKTQIGQG